MGVWQADDNLMDGLPSGSDRCMTLGFCGKEGSGIEV